MARVFSQGIGRLGRALSRHDAAYPAFDDETA